MMPKCDKCDQPATLSVMDIIEREKWQSGHVESEPIGKAKHGCDAHPPVAYVYRSSAPIVDGPSERRPDDHLFEMALSPTGLGWSRLDGRDIAHMLRGVSIETEAGEMSRVTLKLTRNAELNVELSCAVSVNAEEPIRRLLDAIDAFPHEREEEEWLAINALRLWLPKRSEA